MSDLRDKIAYLIRKHGMDTGIAVLETTDAILALIPDVEARERDAYARGFKAALEEVAEVAGKIADMELTAADASYSNGYSDGAACVEQAIRATPLPTEIIN